MKAVALIVLATAGSLAIIIAGIALRSGPDRPSPDTVVEAGSPGALVLVDDGSSRREETSGLAVLEGRVPLRAHDRFRIGSITKTFVAVVVLQLVDEHVLGLKDTVERWLPGLVPSGRQITVQQLLAHTSGLADYADDPDFVRRTVAQPRRRWTPRELVGVALARGPVARPGERFAYASTNYILLGMMVERATGTSLERQLRGRIFVPLGLEDTSFEPDAWKRRHYAHGYAPSEHDGIVGSLATARDRRRSAPPGPGPPARSFPPRPISRASSVLFSKGGCFRRACSSSCVQLPGRATGWGSPRSTHPAVRRSATPAPCSVPSPPPGAVVMAVAASSR